MSIYQKLFDITHSVKRIEQDQTKNIPYKITSWNKVNEAIREELKNKNLLLLPRVLEHSKEGNLTVVKMSCDIKDLESNESITIGDYYGYGVDNSDKGVGKATTYAYKYLIMKLFMLEVGEAEDSEFSNPPVQNKSLGRKETIMEREEDI